MFNAKNKPNGKISYKVNDVRKEGGSTIMDLTAQFEDEKGKQRPPYIVRYTCTGDELVADLSGMMQAMQSNMKDMELKMKTNKLSLSGQIQCGAKIERWSDRSRTDYQWHYHVHNEYDNGQ